MTIDKQTRISRELAKARISNFNRHKSAVRILIGVMNEDEHVLAAVVGRNAHLRSTLMALTDSRLIYIEADLLFHFSDSIMIKAIHGIKLMPTPILDGITVQSRAGEYSISGVAPASAEKFVREVDEVMSQDRPLLVDSDLAADQNQQLGSDPVQATISKSQAQFLAKHHSGVLTVGSRTGHAKSWPIYYIFDHSTIFVLIRSKDDIAQLVLEDVTNPVNCTVFDTATLASVHIDGLSTVVEDKRMVKKIHQDISNLSLRPSVQPDLFDESKGKFEVLAISVSSISDTI